MLGKPFRWDFNLKLQSDRKITFFDFYSHPIKVQFSNEAATTMFMTFQNGENFLDKDFTFLYTTKQFELPSYVFGRTD